jgi:hypothetical protein
MLPQYGTYYHATTTAANATMASEEEERFGCRVSPLERDKGLVEVRRTETMDRQNLFFLTESVWPSSAVPSQRTGHDG